MQLCFAFLISTFDLLMPTLHLTSFVAAPQDRVFDLHRNISLHKISMEHFGEEVVYNTFDQNRFFIGIKKNINPKWSYDFGYMNVYQQKYSGYQYDMNHTIRLFFYLSTSIRKKAPSEIENSGDE